MTSFNDKFRDKCVKLLEKEISHPYSRNIEKSIYNYTIDVAEKNNISSLLIANKDDIRNIALGKTSVKSLRGWRYQIFGSTALKFIEGKASIKNINGKIIID